MAQHRYKRRIRKMAWESKDLLPSTEVCDLEQELLEVLWLCCNAYDPDRGATFSTFFETSARRRLTDLHRTASRKKRVGDYSRVWLEDQSLRYAIESVRLEESAEEFALAEMHVIELFRVSG